MKMASLSSLFFLSRSSFSFLIFFLYFSMHACNSDARSLRVTNAGSLKEFLDCKIGEKIKLTMDSFRKGANTFGHQHDSSSSWIPVQFDAIFGSKAKEEKEDASTKSGRKVVESSSRMNFLKATKTEVSRGSAAEQDMKVEAISSQNSIGHEDIMETDDYQPPHRNSPIHNK